MKVGIIGATGAAGQRFVQLLKKHPWFELTFLGASDKNIGKKYHEATNWIIREEPIPEEFAEIKLESSEASELKKEGVEAVFSCLPAEVAKEKEIEFASQGIFVFSTASSFRMEKDVPIIIPEANPDHCEIVKEQQKNRDINGFISTDPNCSAVGLVMTLAPLKSMGIKRVTLTTMQALSGAGYPGVASLDIIDNVIPFIANEEEKIQRETVKILGEYNAGGIDNAGFGISASCNRVFARDGHLESVFIEFAGSATREEIEAAWKEFNPLKNMGLPSYATPLEVLKQENRPQHRFDAMKGKGMTVTIGRLRPDAFGWKYSCLSHNTIRGAAGGTIYQAELYKKKGLM